MIALVVHFFHASQSLSLASRLALLAAAAAEESTLMNFPHFCLVSLLDRLDLYLIFEKSSCINQIQ